MRVTREHTARWVDFAYGYVAPGATIPGGAGNARAYGWIVVGHAGPDGRPVRHARE